MVRSRNPLPEWPLLSLSSSMAPCFLFLLLLFLLSATIDGQRHNHWGHHSARHKSATSDALYTQIRQACKASRFPNVCESTLSDSDSFPPNPSPSDFIPPQPTLLLQTTHSMIQSILDASEKALNINCTNTDRICLEVLSYFDHRLFAAFFTAFPAGALNDARAWASTALLHQYDRWSDLKYVNNTVQVSDAMAFTSLPSIGTGPSLPLPLCSILLGRIEALCSTHQGRTGNFHSVYQDRTEEDKGKGAPERPESEREGELKGRNHGEKGSRCQRGEGEREGDGAERGLLWV